MLQVLLEIFNIVHLNIAPQHLSRDAAHSAQPSHTTFFQDLHPNIKLFRNDDKVSIQGNHYCAIMAHIPSFLNQQIKK